jgi:O-antigen ligase
MTEEKRRIIETRSVSGAASTLLACGLLFLSLGVFVGNVPIAVGQILLVFGVAIGLVQQRNFLHHLRRLPISSWWLFAFALFAIVSVVANFQEIDKPLSFIKKTRYFLIYPSVLLVPFITWQALSRAWLKEAMIIVWLVPLILALVVGSFYVLGLGPTVRTNAERLSGLHGEVMTFAYGLQFSVIALGILFFTPSLWKSITGLPWKLVAIFAVVAGISMYLTYSRGAMLGVASGLFVFAVMRSRYLVMGLVAFGLILVVLSFLQGNRYFNFEEPLRGNQWTAATVAFIENPLFGLGFRNFEIQSVELKQRCGIEMDWPRMIKGIKTISYFKGHAHNNYIEAFASTGVFGGISLIAFCISWCREVWRSRYRIIFGPLIVAFIVSGFFENTFYDSEVLNCILLIYLFSQIAISSESSENSGLDEATLPE